MARFVTGEVSEISANLQARGLSTQARSGLHQRAAGLWGKTQQVQLGDLILDIIEEENPKWLNKVTKQPVESKQNVADHIWHEPLIFTIQAVFSSLDESHKERLRRLEEMAESDETYEYITGFPPYLFEPMAIADISPVYSVDVGMNAYAVTITLERVNIVTEGQQGARLSADPVTGRHPQRRAHDVGDRAGKFWTIPPHEPVGSPAKTGLQSGDGGLLGMLSNIVNSALDFGKSDLGKTLLNFAKDQLMKNIPGADTVLDALQGKLSAMSLIRDAAKLIPGGGQVVDMVLSGVDVMNKAQGVLGAVQRGDYVSALTAASGLGIPGTSGLLSQASGILSTLQGAQGNSALSLLSSVSSLAAGKAPTLSDVGRMVGSWLTTR